MPPRDCRSYRTLCVHSVFFGRDCHAHHTSCTYHVDVADGLPLASHFLLPFHLLRWMSMPSIPDGLPLVSHFLRPYCLLMRMPMTPKHCHSSRTSCVHTVFFDKDCLGTATRITLHAPIPFSSVDVDDADGLPLVSHFMFPLCLHQWTLMLPRDCRWSRTFCAHDIFLVR